MKTLVLCFSVLFTVTLVACKSKQSANSSTNNAKTEVASPSTYRLIVSFISIGTGVDGDAYSKLEKFVQEHPKKPAFEQKRWGREGEVDFMFSLKEFKSAADPAKFINDLKAAIGKSDRVQYKENEKSR